MRFLAALLALFRGRQQEPPPKVEAHVGQTLAITLRDYLMGRDELYASELTDEIRDNATILLGMVNALFEEASAEGIAPAFDQITHTHVASGWRPRGINARTANAATNSAHLTGEAIDVQDHADRRLARWCFRNLESLERIGLWMEDPRWTAGRASADPWVHLQSRRAKRRVFIPSTNPPTAKPLPEQQGAIS